MSSVRMKQSRISCKQSSRSPIVSGMRVNSATTSSSRRRVAFWNSMLSENQCEGWLEGYLLTGRHGHNADQDGFEILRVGDNVLSGPLTGIDFQFNTV